MRSSVVVALVVLFGAAGCSSSKGTRCEPNLEVLCRCSGGQVGKQVCLASGSGFGPCGSCGAVGPDGGPPVDAALLDRAVASDLVDAASPEPDLPVGVDRSLPGDAGAPDLVASDLSFDSGVDGATDMGGPTTITCLTQACVPVIVYAPPDTDSPGTLALDATNLYWTEYASGEIRKAPKLGGATPVTLDTDNTFPKPIVVDQTFVYWSNSGGGGNANAIRRVPIDGSSAAVTLAMDQGFAVAIDATNVYWGTDDALRLVPQAGGSAADLVSVPGTVVSDVVADSSGVYFTGPGGFIQRVARTGGQATSLSSMADHSGYLALDDTFVFGASSVDSAIVRVPKSGGALVTLAIEEFPIALRVDADHVYWFNLDGSLLRVPKAGGATELLATGQTDVYALAVDDANIYWATSPPTGGGSILRLAK